MKDIIRTELFKKQIKKLLKKHYNIAELETVLNCLVSGTKLPGKYKKHSLSGNWQGFEECHIRSNWLVIYRVTEKVIELVATGTHDDLFK